MNNDTEVPISETFVDMKRHIPDAYTISYRQSYAERVIEDTMKDAECTEYSTEVQEVVRAMLRKHIEEQPDVLVEHEDDLFIATIYYMAGYVDCLQRLGLNPEAKK